MNDLATQMEQGLAAKEPENTDVIDRTPPEPANARKALVDLWQQRIKLDRDHWEREAFEQMRADMKFARGDQWSGRRDDKMFNDDPGERYVANIVLRHIHQRTAAIYGKNPTFVSRREDRMDATVWDGEMSTLQRAMETSALAIESGMPPPQEASAILEDAQRVLTMQDQLAKIGKSLELVYRHEIDEQSVPFKVQMKANIRRTLTTGVSWLKLGYQRVMELRPEAERAISDMSERLAAIERLSADAADGETQPEGPETEQLRAMIESMRNTQEVLVREGLSLSYPESTAIIPDRTTRQLRGFVGARWVTEQYMLTADRIKEVYKVDVGAGGATGYHGGSDGHFKAGEKAHDVGDSGVDAEHQYFCVWETYCKTDGLVYVTCDGYGDFLVEPAEPDVWLERFWPWFPFVTNEVYDEKTVFPPSDVSLMRDMQLELNRARQGLREHRRAARPRTYVRTGLLSEDDKDKVADCKAHAIVELSGLGEKEKVDDVLRNWSGSGVDNNLYDPTPAYTDIMRVVGTQEANLGGTSGATATESSIAEGSRMSSVSSVIDDLDEFLSDFSRAAGSTLLLEMEAATVKEIVGQGAVWPEFSRKDVARQVYLDIEAASSGRPNKQQEIQNAREIMPLLMQVPGLSPEWLAREMLRRMDDRLDLKDAFDVNMPSIQALNRMGQLTGGGPEADPNAQGDAGAFNAPGTRPPRQNIAPTTPSAPDNPVSE